LNAVGDIVLTQPHELRALADPARLGLFDLVQRRGPVTVDQLGDDGDAVRSDLNELEAAGLIEESSEGWTTPAKGIYFEIPEHGEEAQRAARDLSGVMLAGAAELPKRWIDDVEPGLDVEWARASGLFNARVDLSPDELRGLQDELERLLEPFTNRDPSERPADAATVRLLTFFLPEPR
jgi:DNA-binding transcriptional ArsR family regulator